MIIFHPLLHPVHVPGDGSSPGAILYLGTGRGTWSWMGISESLPVPHLLDAKQEEADDG